MTLRFGAFIPPFHSLDEDPTTAFWRDLDLIEWLDVLGIEEAWVGEHHSGGWSTVSSPELFLAAAAERTRRIKLGTGVVSLPYHHPSPPRTESFNSTTKAVGGPCSAWAQGCRPRTRT